MTSVDSSQPGQGHCRAWALPPTSSRGEMARVRMRAAQRVFGKGKGHVAELMEAALPRRTAVAGREGEEREGPSGTSPKSLHKKD